MKVKHPPRALTWPTDASNSWPIPMMRSMEDLEMRPSSPHLVNKSFMFCQMFYVTRLSHHFLRGEVRGRMFVDACWPWCFIVPLLPSKSDVPDVPVGGEPLYLWGCRSPGDGLAHAPDDGAGGHPWPCGTGTHNVAHTSIPAADVLQQLLKRMQIQTQCRPSQKG